MDSIPLNSFKNIFDSTSLKMRLAGSKSQLKLGSLDFVILSYVDAATTKASWHIVAKARNDEPSELFICAIHIEITLDVELEIPDYEAFDNAFQGDRAAF